MNVTLLQQGGIGGGPEFTSPSFTPTAGDCVLIVYSLQGNHAAITFTAPGYTWNYIGTFISADNDVTMSAAWALNVPGGAVSFSTTNLGFSAMTYYLFDLGGVVAQDQMGEVLTPNPTGGSAAQVTTAGPLAQAGEIAVAWQQTQYPVTVTPLPGYTTTQQQANTNFSPLLMVAAWNPAAGPAGSPQTGGWSVATPGAGNAMILTFMGPSSGPGLQPGFAKSGRIEEPSEGMQESNVVPPDMGTIQG